MNGSEFGERIARIEGQLQRVDEQQAGQPWAEGKWRRKEVLGHLLDSAANNHVRFAFAAIQGSYTGPKYNQEGWVQLHHYADLSWSELMQHWKLRNQMLTRLVGAIPESRWETQCRIGDGEPVTLWFLVTDYLDHMEGHIRQILTGIV